MGYIRHHAIVVTSFDGNMIEDLHERAKEIFTATKPSEVMLSGINGYMSFFIPPDGSKEGWSHSDEGDDQREEFIRYMESKRYEDGSTCIDWAEIQYGDDDGFDKLLRSCNTEKE